jgi:hypothetical protein
MTIRYFHFSYFGPYEDGDILYDVETGRVYRVTTHDTGHRLRPPTDAAICDGCGELLLNVVEPLDAHPRHNCRFNGHLRRPSAEDENRPVRSPQAQGAR